LICTQIKNAITLEEERRIPKLPDVKLQMKWKEQNTYLIVIEAQNDVPFECQFLIKEPNGSILSGIPLDWTRVFPNSSSRRFTMKETIKRMSLDNTKLVLKFNLRGLLTADMTKNPIAKIINQTYEVQDSKTILVNEEIQDV
jgi:hypothetical protein